VGCPLRLTASRFRLADLLPNGGEGLLRHVPQAFARSAWRFKTSYCCRSGRSANSVHANVIASSWRLSR
jgi:hypothetical protein